jgi:drug/metabolite transporter (DMT)-like permease
VFGSAFFFYLSTLVIRWAQGTVAIDPAYYVFSRFLLGFVVVAAAMGFRREGPRVRNWHFLIGRAFSNSLAVFCFYKAVSLTTVAEANILNMTYPLFVTLYAWTFLKQQRDLPATGALLAAFAGVWLILSPGEIGLHPGNLWGLASGALAAAAIVYLNLCRRDHDTLTILFFLFGLGALGIYAVYADRIFLPGRRELGYLAACAASGVIGQFLLTLGFRHVTAVEGSVLSSTRILLAALLGPLLAADPPLAAWGWIGALLIFGADVFLAARKAAH